jgi:hypothetical protein
MRIRLQRAGIRRWFTDVGRRQRQSVLAALVIVGIVFGWLAMRFGDPFWHRVASLAGGGTGDHSRTTPTLASAGLTVCGTRPRGTGPP